MAGDWLKFEKATLDKPEVLAIAAALQQDPDWVVGKLLRMWSWFDTHTTDGNAPSVTPALLDSILRVTGFVVEAEKAGWLQVRDDGISLPNFGAHNGETAKQRALTAKRVADFKAGNGKGNAPSVTDALPREEKRREEKAKTKASASPDGDTPASNDPIPYQAIVTAYNATMANLAKVREVTSKRRTLIRSAWQASPQRRNLEFWRDAYFPECQDDAFLNGTGPYTSGHESWRPTFDYLMRPDVVTRVFERAMDRMERAA